MNSFNTRVSNNYHNYKAHSLEMFLHICVSVVLLLLHSPNSIPIRSFSTAFNYVIGGFPLISSSYFSRQYVIFSSVFLHCRDISHLPQSLSSSYCQQHYFKIFQHRSISLIHFPCLSWRFENSLFTLLARFFNCFPCLFYFYCQIIILDYFLHHIFNLLE